MESAASTGLGTPIVNRHIADAVVDRLVTAVALGLYVAGQQLPAERELAVLLKVSRSSIREALQQLTQDGYLEVRRGRNGGYFVQSTWGPRSVEHVRRQIIANWTSFEHVFDARILIEQQIAATAARRRTEDDLRQINAALDAYIVAPDHEHSRRADGALHLAIARATQNPILADLSMDFRARISLNLGAEPYTDSVRQIAIGQHRQLVALIEAGDAEAAAALAAEHFALSERLFRQLAQAVQPAPQAGEGAA